MTATLRALLLPVDGTAPRLVDVPADWEPMAKVVGGEYVEHVRTRLPGVAMIVDEEGALREDRVLNRRATLFYPGSIFGAALLLAEIDTPEGRDVASLTSGQYVDALEVLAGIRGLS